MRDPLTDPRPGDVVVSAKNRKREVAYVTITDTIVYDALGKKTTSVDNTCDLKTWKRWASKGAVVKRGPDEPRLPHERPIAFDLDLQGQIMGIANKVMNDDKRPLEEGIGMTPNDEALRAIIEIGLAHYWSYAYEARWRVRDRIIELCEQKKAARDGA